MLPAAPPTRSHSKSGRSAAGRALCPVGTGGQAGSACHTWTSRPPRSPAPARRSQVGPAFRQPRAQVPQGRKIPSPAERQHARGALGGRNQVLKGCQSRCSPGPTFRLTIPSQGPQENTPKDEPAIQKPSSANSHAPPQPPNGKRWEGLDGSRVYAPEWSWVGMQLPFLLPNSLPLAP